MNHIVISDTKNIDVENLQRLFVSVGWESGNYPDKLAKVISRFSVVFSAWNEKCLVGLLCSFDDGYLNAYIQYLLVDPKFQGEGIGRKLMELLMDQYQNLKNISLLSYKESIEFYKALGFEQDNEAFAMSHYRFATNPKI